MTHPKRVWNGPKTTTDSKQLKWNIMINIGELLVEDIHRPFISLWLRLTENYPLFQAVEQTSLDDMNRHKEVKESVINLLMENPPLISATNIDTKFPLAILEALDEFLDFDKGTREDSPTAMKELYGKTYLVYRRVRRIHYKIRHVQQTGHIRSYLRHHWIIPEEIHGIKISVTKIPAYLPVANFLEKKKIKSFIGSFTDGITPLWNKEHLPDYRAETLTDKEERWKGIQDLLHEAIKAKADILVLPELTVCQDLRERVALWLDENSHPFYLVLPGSFHQSSCGEYYNYGELLNMRGKPVLSHRKLTTFGEPGEREKITTGATIHLLDTPIGLIAMPICLDFCEESSPFADLWQIIGADWHLVPAYGGKENISAHNKRAAGLNRAHGAMTVLSNQPVTLNEGSSNHHGFAYFSGNSTNISPKSRCISMDLE